MQLWIALLKTATKKSASSIVTHMGGLIRKVWNGENRKEDKYAMQVENTHLSASTAIWNMQDKK